MDPFLPLSPDGDATAQASPAVAMMRAAAEAKQRALSQQALQNQYKQSEEDRMNQQNQLAAARQQHLLKADQSGENQRTMAGDMAITSQNPTYKGTKWDTLDSVDPGLRQSYADRYGVDAMGNAQQLWDRNTPQYDRALRQQATKGGYVFPPDATDDEVRTGYAEHVQQQQAAKANQVPSNIRQQLANLGKWKEGMTLEDAGNTLNQAYVDNGTIPPQHVPAAMKLMTAIQHDKVIAPFAAQKDAYDALKTGFQNPQSGGYGDMAMIEGLQRILNPGATVRQATIQNMKDAQGWLQNLDPHFQWQKATQGDKLSPEAKQRIMQLADAKFSQSEREAQRSLAGKRLAAGMLGIPPQLAGPLVDNLITYVGRGQQLDESGIPVDGQPAQGQQQPQAPNAAPAQAPAAAQVPKVASRADFDALPKGAHYIGSNGTEYIKP